MLTIASSDIGIALYNRYFTSSESTVSYTAHLAGAFAGLSIGLTVLENYISHHWEMVLSWTFTTLYILLAAFAIGFNIFNTGHFPSDNDATCFIRNQ